MPRKKIETDVVSQVHQYFTTAPLPAVEAVLSMMRTIVRLRQEQLPSKAVPPRERVLSAPAPLPVSVAATVPAVSTPMPKRTRRMSVSTPKPESEAKPLVPLQDEVGDELNQMVPE